ncbi:MAG: type II secretion system F family protein, partial [Firmicutes bacterium]|nr:type II secretion system F family protein [Bacillota bacterium]
MSKQLDHMGVSAFCESMGMMIRSGIQVDEAVDLLQHGRTKTGGVLESGLAVIKEHVDNGEGLAAAMKASGIFPDYALQMVEAGETSGKLEGILFRLARYYADQKTISEKLKNAVTYPAVMILLIIVLLAVMIRMVLPSFSAVYERLTGSLAASSYGYVRWAYVFCWIALIALVIIAAALLIGYRMWKGGKRESVEALLRKSPVCASILENMAMFRFTSALATFIASGDMQDEAVEKSIPMADYGPVKTRLDRVYAEMQEGHSIAQAAYDEELFEPTYGRMLLAGERSGNLENVLERLTDLLEEHCA